MSVLIAILYPNEVVADDVLEVIEVLSRKGQIDLEDACAMIKDDEGRLRLHQETNLSVLGAVTGLAFGTMLGWIVLLPYLGVPGAILGAIAGKVSDRGIPDQEMKDLGKEMKSSTSALFLLLRHPEMAEGVLRELAPYGGQIFHTSLSTAQEQELQAKLRQYQEKERQEKGAPEYERSPEMHD